MRHVAKGGHGYRIVFRDGLVWLLRANGSPVCVSSWEPVTLAQSVGAGAALATMAAVDGRMHS